MEVIQIRSPDPDDPWWRYAVSGTVLVRNQSVTHKLETARDTAPTLNTQCDGLDNTVDCRCPSILTWRLEQFACSVSSANYIHSGYYSHSCRITMRNEKRECTLAMQTSTQNS